MDVSAWTLQSLWHLLPQHLLEKLAAPGQGPMPWGKNGLRAGLGVLGHGGTPGWAGTRGAPMGSELGLGLFDILTKALHGGIEGPLSQSLTAPGWVGCGSAGGQEGSAEGSGQAGSMG